MNPYEALSKDKAQREEEKRNKMMSLERQLQMWERRRSELRQVGNSALDPNFVRHNIEKCSKEIERITETLSKL